MTKKTEKPTLVSLCTLEFHLPSSQSLKDRRRSLRRLKDRLRQRHNISIAEVGETSKWQRATLALVAVGTDQAYLDGVFQKVIEEAETQPEMILSGVSIDPHL